MKCDTCKHQEVYNLDMMESGAGNCDANCGKGHWSGYGDCVANNAFKVEIRPDPWENCPDYEGE